MAIRWVLRLLVLAVVIGVVAEIVPGIEVHGGFGAAVLGGLLIALFSWLAQQTLPNRRRDELRRA